jgi:signal transduction histidine kinase
MLCLPPLVQSDGCWRLPLCDATAMELAVVLVDENTAGRAPQIAAVLLLDPAFTVWALCRWRQTSHATELPSQPSLAEIADWLSSRLADLLTWPANAHNIELTSEQHGRFAALVAESVGAAQTATAAMSPDDPLRHAIYLGAMLTRWDEWFLAARLDEITSTNPPPHNPIASPSLVTADFPNARAVSDEAWRRWLLEIPGVQTLLPKLVAQQCSMPGMHAHFEARLQVAKLDALKEFAYGAGHELNNPLANIASRAQTLLREESNPERRRRLAAINTQAFRAHEMLADLMLFARPPQLKTEPVDLVQLADEVLQELDAEATAAEIVLHRPTRRDPLVLKVDPVQLRVALRALCVNSMEAIGKQGNITLELCLSDADARGRVHSGDVVQIVVADDGPGISSEFQAKLFDPFFSGREAGRGLGFGLCKCWRIVTLHGGWIDVESQPGQGAIFTLALPALKPEEAAFSLSGAKNQA